MLWRFFHGFWEKFNLPFVRGSETQTKREERGICVVITSLLSLIKLKQ